VKHPRATPMPARHERGIVFLTTTQRAEGVSTTLAQEPYLPRASVLTRLPHAESEPTCGVMDVG
jgi:hypothetical protein